MKSGRNYKPIKQLVRERQWRRWKVDFETGAGSIKVLVVWQREEFEGVKGI
jgi:hypothetical protein